MGRVPLDELKRLVWLELDHVAWKYPTNIYDAIRRNRTDARWNNDRDWYRTALVLERLVNDGHAELRAKRDSSVRRYRRKAQP